MPLFEVEIQNRVVKVSFPQKRIKGTRSFLQKRIQGTQGNWYTEILYYLADSEEEAKKFAIEDVKRRRIIGIPSFTKRKLNRVVEVIDIGGLHNVYISNYRKYKSIWL